MSTYVSKKPWQESYKAALFESDKSKAAERIADAERMTVTRARCLFNHPNNAHAERNALDAALYALNVPKLFTCVEPNEKNEHGIPQNHRLRRSL